ncbi:hypothetical protein [Arthrobacter pigmenti]
MLYQFRQPHVVDATAYRGQFGPGQTTSYEEGIARTLQWYRQAPHQRFTALGT